MLIQRKYKSSTMLHEMIQVESDNGALLKYKGKYYDSLIIEANEIQFVEETQFGIPSPTALPVFISKTFIPSEKPITQEEAICARGIIKELLNTLDDNKVYDVPFLYDVWKENTPYSVGEKINYNNNIYNIINTHISSLTPEEDKVNYSRIQKPANMIETWNENNTPYKIGDRIKIGNYIYESIINNNVWTPIGFPAGWRVV